MRYLTSVACLLSFVLAARAEFRLDRSVMSDKYWALWNDEVQAKIDADIEKYRKADAEVTVAAPDGVEVRVEQLTHDFFFGAHAFNFDQLGKREWNERYRELFGTLFNSATVAFYWKTLEPHPGQVRFNAGYEDTEAFWNSCRDPEYQPHWRRPAPAPVVSYMKTRGVRVHGHPLAWGNVEWHLPSWLWDSYCPASEKFALEQASGVAIPGHDLRFPMGVKEKGRDDFTWPEAWKAVFERLSEDEVAALCPTFFAKMNELVDRRIRDIAAAYGDRVDSWDVCNESSLDFHGKSVTGRPFQVSPRFGVTAGDLCYRAFKTAEEVLPTKAWYNINDYQMDENYVAQVKDLLANGCRIDVVGSQMHLFDPKASADIARGEGPEHMTPSGIAKRFEMLAAAGRPIHLSEITITAPDNSPEGQMIQAIIMRNCYRAWFSVEKMTGITWWNVLDNCGAPGEPSISGIFTRGMQPKTAYFAMDDLVNREWKTKLSVSAKGGKVAFRGFRGKYRLTWSDAAGEHVKLVELK